MWEKYFEATGGLVEKSEDREPDSCIVRSFKTNSMLGDSNSQESFESQLMDDLAARADRLAPRVGAGATATVTLGEAKALTGSGINLDPDINYDNAFTAAANLAGSSGAPGSDIYGADTRSWDRQASTVTIDDVTAPGPGRNVSRDVRLTADLLVHVHDTVDFCPANLGNFWQEAATVPLSKLEAQGMTKDVELKVHYRRHVARGRPVSVPAHRFIADGRTAADESLGPGADAVASGDQTPAEENAAGA